MEDILHLEGRLLVLYDGRCGFCNRSVRWFLIRDRRDRLRFAPSESPAVAGLLSRHGFNDLSPNTILVVREPGSPQERLLTRSNAVVALLSELPGTWPFFAATLRLIPRPIRDSAYNLVASLRYRIAGRHATCPIPTPEEQQHFL